MYPDDNYDEPSGKALPRILRNGRDSGSSSRTDEIEAQLQATVRAWQTLQQQIQRGEDHYVEESGSFNIYKGWDGFIDARLFETMPKRFDYRWFSSSVSHTLNHQPWPSVPTLAETQAKPAPDVARPERQQPLAGAVDEDQNDAATAPTTKRKRVR